MKQCTKCKRILSLGLYYKDRTKKDGYKCRCKECSEKYKNRDNIRKWRKDNRDRVRMSVNKYNNKPSRKEYMKKYWEIYNNNEYRDKKKIYWKQYKIYNRNIILEKQRKYSNTTKGKEIHRLNQMKRRELVRLTDDGTINYDNTQSLLQKQNGKCNMCGCELNQSYGKHRKIDGKHLDHIIPLSKGGIHSINNIQWLCYKCNLSKSNKIF